MASRTKNDELNVLSIEEYFGGMELTNEQKKKRIDLAWELFDIFLALFYLIDDLKDTEMFDRNKTVEAVKEQIIEKVSEYADVDDYIENHAEELVNQVVNTTLKNINGSDYWFSEDRATISAETETDTFLNYADYMIAKGKGYKYKEWLAITDEKTRHSHFKVNHTKIKIDETFMVGNSIMRFPHDTEYGASPEEIINCRCSIRYTN